MGEAKRRKAVNPNYGSYSADEKNQILEDISTAFFDLVHVGIDALKETSNKDLGFLFIGAVNTLYRCHELMERADPLILDLDKRLIFNGSSGILAMQMAGYAFESEYEEYRKMKLILAGEETSNLAVIDLGESLLPERSELSWGDLKRFSSQMKKQHLKS